MTLLAALSAMSLVAGLVVLAAVASGVLVSRPRTESTSSTSLWAKTVDYCGRLSGRSRLLVAIGLVAGVGVALWTGWVIMLVVVPVGVIGVPLLLQAPRQTEIELLQALDRWVRGMTATMASGKSITDALRLSARQPPALLEQHLVLLVRRLDDRWTPGQALLALADDLASADADAVIASLVLATQRGGSGAVGTLAALADTIQDRLRALREIEAERAKPRVVVRQVTVITVVVLSASMLFGGQFFAPYGTPVGQVLLAAIITLYVGSLMMLRRMTLPRRRGRVLRSLA